MQAERPLPTASRWASAANHGGEYVRITEGQTYVVPENARLVPRTVGASYCDHPDPPIQILVDGRPAWQDWQNEAHGPRTLPEGLFFEPGQKITVEARARGAKGVLLAQVRHEREE